MNVQRLIERMEDLKNLFGSKSEYVKIDTVIELISELDEPQKVKIPQYIADKIEYCKESSDWDLFQAMDYCFNFRECSSWLENNNNQEIFAQAWIFGYEVEKEKRYIVKVKAITSCNKFLSFSSLVESWFFCNFCPSDNIKQKHTRKELEEADFGWVFDCEGIEIEEVEE